MASYTASFKINGVPVEYTVDQGYEIVYSYSPEPDPNWVYTDKEGHRHYRDDEGKYPTLHTETTDSWWCEDCREHHEEYELVCNLCYEKVTPGTRPPSPFGTMIPTYKDIRLKAHGDLGEEFAYEQDGETLIFKRISIEIERDTPAPTCEYVVVEVR